MSDLSLRLQAKSLNEMADRKPFLKKLAGFEYVVLPRVYKGSTDTELFCDVLKVGKLDDVWDIGTGTGLVAFQAKRSGARYVLATDFNPDAIKNAKVNSKLLGLDIDIRKANLFGKISRKFDIITFNPPFTDFKAKKGHEISFWDEDHRTVRKFFKGIRSHLKKDGCAYVAWSSFADTRKLKDLARGSGCELVEIGRRKGKMNFIYYVYLVVTASE